MASMVGLKPEARLKIAYEEYVCEVAGMENTVNLGLLPGTVNTGDAGGEMTEPERLI